MTPENSQNSARENTPTAPTEAIPFRIISWAGFALFLLTGFLVPLFAIPVSWTPEFRVRDGIIVMKNILLVALAAGILICGAAMLLGNGWRRYGGRVLLPTGALALFLLWGGLAVLFSPATPYSFKQWLPQLMAAAAALTGPLFLADVRRVKWLLIAIVAGGVLVSSIGAVSATGNRTIYRSIYGSDPRDAFDQDVERAARVQGGARSSAAISTIGNPEYAGTYAAALAALAAIMLFDWAPASRRRWLWRAILITGTALMLLLLAVSATRQPWIAIVFAAIVRLMLYLNVPKRWAAGGFAAFLLCGLFLGAVAGVILLAILLLAMFVYTIVAAGALEKLKQADRFNLAVAAGLPVALMLLLVAFSTPGPWNPMGLRVLQRFGSLLTHADQSYRERATMYMLASQMTWEHPFAGVGQGRYANRFTPTFATLVEEDETGVAALARKRIGRGIGLQTHNDYLQIAAEQGLPALIFFLTAMIFLLGGLMPLAEGPPGWARLTALAVAIALIAFFSIMMTSFPLHMPSRSAVFWSLVACGLGLIASSRQTPSGVSS